MERTVAVRTASSANRAISPKNSYVPAESRILYQTPTADVAPIGINIAAEQDGGQMGGSERSASDLGLVHPSFVSAVYDHLCLPLHQYEK